MVVRIASVTFTNTYVTVYYWKFRWHFYPARPLCPFVEGVRFEVSLRYPSALLFYVPLVSVFSLFSLCIWAVTRVNT
jgi:hypothetical protein